MTGGFLLLGCSFLLLIGLTLLVEVLLYKEEQQL